MRAALDAGTIGEIIQMALSDDVGFDHIRGVHGLSPDEVKVLMRTHLAPGSYRAWRRRVRRLRDQRERYKQSSPASSRRRPQLRERIAFHNEAHTQRS